MAQIVLLPRRQMVQIIVPVILMGLAATLGGLLGLPKYLPFILDFFTESRPRESTRRRMSRCTSRAGTCLFDSPRFQHWKLGVRNEPSVRSLFVTGPVIMLAFSATWKSMKPIAPILIAAFLAAVLALDVVRVFIYSRFPISDYKAYITLGLVVLAAAVFRHLDEVPARVGTRMRPARGTPVLAILCRRTHRDAGCRSRSASDDPHLCGAGSYSARWPRVLSSYAAETSRPLIRRLCRLWRTDTDRSRRPASVLRGAGVASY